MHGHQEIVFELESVLKLIESQTAEQYVERQIEQYSVVDTLHVLVSAAYSVEPDPTGRQAWYANVLAVIMTVETLLDPYNSEDDLNEGLQMYTGVYRTDGFELTDYVELVLAYVKIEIRRLLRTNRW